VKTIAVSDRLYNALKREADICKESIEELLENMIKEILGEE